MKEKSAIIHLFLAALIGVSLAISVHLLLGSYFRYLNGQENKTILEGQVRVLRKYEQDLKKHAAVMSDIERFNRKVGEYGLSPGNWNTYPVTIRESLSFSEAATVLMQAGKTASYYFQPQNLQLNRRPADTPAHAASAGKTEAGGSQPLRMADLLLSLQGAFVVKQN